MAQTTHDLVEDDDEKSLSNASIGISNAVDIMQWRSIVGGQLARPAARPLHGIIPGIGFSCNGSEWLLSLIIFKQLYQGDAGRCHQRTLSGLRSTHRMC